MNINWNSNETAILINPRMPKSQAARIQACLQSSQNNYPGHIWISTSGTTTLAKWAGLSRQALLASAAAVNKHLMAVPKDIWFNPLPVFHVGGLGIWARAYQNGAKCMPYEEKWNPHTYAQKLAECKATLGSLVPTHVHDLVANGIAAPKSLRAIIVGGARLSDALYEKARELGWPLLPSYGLTECASQVATAELSAKNPRLHLLSHIEGSITPAGLIALKSPALLSAYAHISSNEFTLSDPKASGWYVTTDRGAIEGKYITLFGRKDDMFKIGGENVDFAQLELVLDELKGSFDMVLVPFPDPRLDTAVHLCTSVKDTAQINSIVESFNSRVMPYEKIRKIHFMEALPRNEIGKIKRSEIVKEFS